jgi:HD-GYP domain-containing protein (c-di-GMP phosphodiesterase class II)
VGSGVYVFIEGSSVKKRLDVRDLKLGMYVSGLDRPWLETPFLFQGFLIDTDEQLATLRQYCRYVDIDTEQGSEIQQDKTPAPEHVTQPRKIAEDDLERKRIEFDMLRAQARPIEQTQTYEDLSDVEDEIRLVADAYRDSITLMQTVFEDAQKKRNIDTAGITISVGRLANSIIRNPDALMLFSQIKDKDNYTAQHSLRVCILALTFGRQLGMELSAIKALGIGAMLHDIGKVRIPDEILKKPEKLTKPEIELMKLHVPYGLQILRAQAPGLPTVALDVVGWHHERYDGSGYMSGAKGNEISQFGHIGGITDHFDALTSDRPWRKGAAHHTTLMKMYDQRGKLFHPVLIEQFIRSMGVYPIGSVVQLNTGEAGVVITRNRNRHLRPRVVVASKADNSLYDEARTVDLTKDRAPDGRMYEIVRVLGPDEHSINPIDHLPVLAA